MLYGEAKEFVFLLGRVIINAPIMIRIDA